MSSVESFVAFVPLSNWLRGFDRYGMRYSKALIRESTFPDAFYMLKEDEPFAPGLEKARRLVTRLARRRIAWWRCGRGSRSGRTRCARTT